MAAVFGGRVTELRNEQAACSRQVDHAIQSHDGLLDVQRADLNWLQQNGGGAKGPNTQQYSGLVKAVIVLKFLILLTLYSSL